MSVSANIEALTRALDCFGRGDLDGYLKLYAPEVLVHGYSEGPMDADEVRAFYAGIFAAFPDARVEALDVFGVDERVTCRFEMHATHQGEFFGAPATGRSIVQRGITVLRFDDQQRCVERWSVADMFGVLMQLGIGVPAG